MGLGIIVLTLVVSPGAARFGSTPAERCSTSSRRDRYGWCALRIVCRWTGWPRHDSATGHGRI